LKEDFEKKEREKNEKKKKNYQKTTSPKKKKKKADQKIEEKVVKAQNELELNEGTKSSKDLIDFSTDQKNRIKAKN